MNELRMYVEHLFEGRVLTSENIELKEEIYGNLVARYEDYVAQGMSAADALEKTKASIPNIEDVFSGSGNEPFGASFAAPVEEDGDGCQGGASEEPGVAAPCAPELGAAAQDAGQSAAERQSQVPDQPQTAAQAQPDGLPQAPQQPQEPGIPQAPDQQGGTQGGARKPRRTWLIVLGVIAAVLVLFVVGLFAFNVLDDHMDRVEGITEAQVEAQQGTPTGQSGAGNNGSGNGSGASGNGSGSGSRGNTQRALPFGDPDDPYEYEMSSDLGDQIMAHSIDTLKTYAGEAPTAQFFSQLPLGSYIGSTGFAESGDQVSISYYGLPDALDGDAIDCALVYNSVAMFATYPELTSVSFTLHEHDHDHDPDVYLFSRDQLEAALGRLSGGSITLLDSALFETESSWDTVRSYITTESFYDEQCDVAEVN